VAVLDRVRGGDTVREAVASSLSDCEAVSLLVCGRVREVDFVVEYVGEREAELVSVPTDSEAVSPDVLVEIARVLVTLPKESVALTEAAEEVGVRVRVADGGNVAVGVMVSVLVASSVRLNVRGEADREGVSGAVTVRETTTTDGVVDAVRDAVDEHDGVRVRLIGISETVRVRDGLSVGVGGTGRVGVRVGVTTTTVGVTVGGSECDGEAEFEGVTVLGGVWVPVSGAVEVRLTVRVAVR
jgi:hypothetical protein